VKGGGGELTVNVIALLVPVLPVTVMVPAPGIAPALIVNIAVICVALTTLTFEIPIPALLATTLAPDTKLNPVMVTATVTPVTLLVGDIAEQYGVEASTVLEALLVMPAYVAVIVADEGVDGVVVLIAKDAVEDPAATTTLGGTPAKPGLELERLTVTPP
jgi:hypothetical protein